MNNRVGFGLALKCTLWIAYLAIAFALISFLPRALDIGALWSILFSSNAAGILTLFPAYLIRDHWAKRRGEDLRKSSLPNEVIEYLLDYDSAGYGFGIGFAAFFSVSIGIFAVLRELGVVQLNSAWFVLSIGASIIGGLIAAIVIFAIFFSRGERHCEEFRQIIKTSGEASVRGVFLAWESKKGAAEKEHGRMASQARSRKGANTGC